MCKTCGGNWTAGVLPIKRFKVPVMLDNRDVVALEVCAGVGVEILICSVICASFACWSITFGIALATPLVTARPALAAELTATSPAFALALAAPSTNLPWANARFAVQADKTKIKNS